VDQAVRHASIKQLQESLPVLDTNLSPDDKLRAALRPMVARMVDVGAPEPVETTPWDCPNCGCPTDSLKSPYCSEHCREMAAFVRQFRAAIDNGMISSPDRQAAFGQKLWSLRGGGYPRRQLMVPARVVAKVIERDGGKCRECGAPATGIDHTGSG
jgi:hypothetical protein